MLPSMPPVSASAARRPATALKMPPTAERSGLADVNVAPTPELASPNSGMSARRVPCTSARQSGLALPSAEAIAARFSRTLSSDGLVLCVPPLIAPVVSGYATAVPRVKGLTTATPMPVRPALVTAAKARIAARSPEPSAPSSRETSPEGAGRAAAKLPTSMPPCA
jgi:hypothetical protein